MATALFILGMGLPGLATAVPANFDVLSGGTLTVTIVTTNPWATGMETRFEVQIEGGQAILDPETGIVSALSLNSGSRSYGLESLSLLGGRTHLPLDAAGHSFLTVVLPGGDWLVRYAFDIHLKSIPVSPLALAGAPVPEPTAALLFAAGIVAVGAAGKRRSTR